MRLRVCFQIQHKGVSFVERACTPLHKSSVPPYRFLNFSGKNQCIGFSQLALLFMYYGFDLELQGQGFLVSVVLLQSIYFTVSITAGTNVPHLSHTRYSAELLNNVVWCSNWFAKKAGCSRPCRNRTEGQSQQGCLRQKEEGCGQQKGRAGQGLIARLRQICNETSQTQKTS